MLTSSNDNIDYVQHIMNAINDDHIHQPKMNMSDNTIPILDKKIRIKSVIMDNCFDPTLGLEGNDDFHILPQKKPPDPDATSHHLQYYHQVQALKLHRLGILPINPPPQHSIEGLDWVCTVMRFFFAVIDAC